MALSKKEKEYLDKLNDELFLALIYSVYSAKVPIIEKCTKEEYDSHHKENATFEEMVEYLLSDVRYRRIPYWNNGGGILDQISGKEPDGYRYEKIIGYKDILMMGSDMIEYCQTRECMKDYFKV